MRNIIMCAIAYWPIVRMYVRAAQNKCVFMCHCLPFLSISELLFFSILKKQVVSPAAQRVLYEQSMQRLMKNIANAVDPAHNLIYTLVTSNLDSLANMQRAMSILNQKLVRKCVCGRVYAYRTIPCVCIYIYLYIYIYILLATHR